MLEYKRSKSEKGQDCPAKVKSGDFREIICRLAGCTLKQNKKHGLLMSMQMQNNKVCHFEGVQTQEITQKLK